MEGGDLLDTALTAARTAAAVHREHLGRIRHEDWSEKGTADFVTHVDREAESRIVECVRQRFPGHTILAEEETGDRISASRSGSASGSAGSPARDGWLWIVDPLDGTTNYLHGYPMYAVSIGVAHRGVLQAAVVLNSATGEEWTAVRGAGARLNGSSVRVSAIDVLPHALIGTGFPFKALHLLPLYTAQFAVVLRSCSGVRRAGSAALDLCHVATGWFDGFWELTLAPWDIAAGALIVREAGGIVTRLDGDDDVLGDGPIVAGNPAIHALLAQLVNGAAV